MRISNWKQILIHFRAEWNKIFISHHSTAIKGSSLTEEECRLLIVDGITAKGKPLYDYNMVKDHFEALRFIVEEAKKKREITPVFIRNTKSAYQTSSDTRLYLSVSFRRPFLFSQHPSVCRWKRKNFTLIDELYSLLSSTPSSHYIQRG